MPNDDGGQQGRREHRDLQEEIEPRAAPRNSARSVAIAAASAVTTVRGDRAWKCRRQSCGYDCPVARPSLADRCWRSSAVRLDASSTQRACGRTRIHRRGLSPSCPGPCTRRGEHRRAEQRARDTAPAAEEQVGGPAVPSVICQPGRSAGDRGGQPREQRSAQARGGLRVASPARSGPNGAHDRPLSSTATIPSMLGDVPGRSCERLRCQSARTATPSRPIRPAVRQRPGGCGRSPGSRRRFAQRRTTSAREMIPPAVRPRRPAAGYLGPRHDGAASDGVGRRRP
jgi:hypothetical protein